MSDMLLQQKIKEKNVFNQQKCDIFGEVFTPFEFVQDKQLKSLETYYFEKYNQNVWQNEKLTFLDPCNGTGVYLICVFQNLFEGLKEKIKNPNKRQKHIIENQIFGIDIQKENCDFFRQLFLDFKVNIKNENSLKLPLDQIYPKVKFDFIIGNPPYNKIKNQNNKSMSPLYHEFIEKFVDQCQFLSFLIPSRWFKSGKGLDKFRKMMIERTDIVYINNFKDASKIFGKNVQIEGGVNYFLIDRKYNGLCNLDGIQQKLNEFEIVLEQKYFDLINKIFKDKNQKTLQEIYIQQSYFKIETNDKRFKGEKGENDILCYVSKKKGFIKYIDKKHVEKEYNFVKVLTPSVSGSEKEGFGNIFIGDENCVFPKTYIGFKMENEQQAKYLQHYLKTKFANFLLKLSKNTKQISSKTLRFLPLVSLDRFWNDEELFEYFELNDIEKEMIKL